MQKERKKITSLHVRKLSLDPMEPLRVKFFFFMNEININEIVLHGWFLLSVYKMGPVVMYDLFLSHYNKYNFNLFSLMDDVAFAFHRIIIQLK